MGVTLGRRIHCAETRPEPCGIVIFGASGDLSARKLFPALRSLVARGLAPEPFHVLGCARTPGDDASFRARLAATLPAGAPTGTLLSRCHYEPGDYGDPALYRRVADRLAALDREHGTGGARLHYLAVPPPLYGTIAARLAAAGLSGADPAGAPVRAVVEKPFGLDLASARALNASLHAAFREEQVFRIDHYLGKDTVQNVLMFRFANSMFEPLWNRDRIERVEITVAESIGVGHRAGYYDGAGCLRDMFQNHMLQMLALVAMEPPVVFDAERFHDEKVKLLRSIRRVEGACVDRCLVRGRYARSGDLAGYLEEPGVPAGSTTETYVAARLHVDNWRWRGVPFYLRSGKRLAARRSEIAITFRPVPHSIFPTPPEALERDRLLFRVQPDEGVSLTVLAKTPGPALCMSPVSLEFGYAELFGGTPPEAYERLFLDAMTGDRTLFIRDDDQEEAWHLLEPVLARWADPAAPPPESYPAGSEGPPGAAGLLEPGHAWSPMP